jgi:hypothetical protein
MQNLGKVCKKIDGTLNVPLSMRKLGGGMFDHSSSALKSNYKLNKAKITFFSSHVLKKAIPFIFLMFFL